MHRILMHGILMHGILMHGICEKRIKKSKDAKTICRIYVKDRSNLERKEQEINGK